MLKLTAAEALDRLGRTHETYARLLARPDFDVGIYRPEAVDDQAPHKRDELYVISAGTGEFLFEGETAPFEPGDIFFAPAGAEHRFLNFSPDFATWVIFIGQRTST